MLCKHTRACARRVQDNDRWPLAIGIHDYGSAAVGGCSGGTGGGGGDQQRHRLAVVRVRMTRWRQWEGRGSSGGGTGGGGNAPIGSTAAFTHAHAHTRARAPLGSTLHWRAPPCTSRHARTATRHTLGTRHSAHGVTSGAQRPGRARASAGHTPVAPEVAVGSSTAARQRGGAAAQQLIAALLQLLLPLRGSSAAMPRLHLRTRAATPEAVRTIELGLGAGRQASPRGTRARIAVCGWPLCQAHVRRMWCRGAE